MQKIATVTLQYNLHITMVDMNWEQNFFGSSHISAKPR